MMQSLLLLLVACGPTEVANGVPDAVTPPVDLPSLVPTGTAPDFTVDVQGGDSLTLSSHAGDVLLIDISGFT